MKEGFKILVFAGLIQACNSNLEVNDIEIIKNDISILASDSLMGREVGTVGEKMAAAYIENEFQKIGLLPLGTEGFNQTFFVKDADNPHAMPSNPEVDEPDMGITGINVLGYQKGNTDKWLVIGAHYDHLGMGDFSSLHRGEQDIHNGADDNASGTAALLHLARRLSGKTLNHNVLFFAISGEEKGLWGSNYFVKNPTLDLDLINFMINMDMVGRLDTSRALAIHGTGTSPSWPGLLEIANQDSIPLVLKSSGTGPSDHTSFYLQDIPVLHFFTGQHEDYHRPSDDAEKLNYEGILAVSELIYRLVLDLDDEPKLAFTKTKDESSSAPRFTVTLGVVPDYLFDGTGMRIDGVSEDKPAQKAGIIKGDVVIQLGDSLVTDMMSYMRALSSFNKGDQTIVKVNRNEEILEFPVEF
jgi:hypothetical protein